MRYFYDMFSGGAQLASLDNDPVLDLRWTTLLDRFTNGQLPGATR